MIQPYVSRSESIAEMEQDRDFQRETNELQLMAQSGPYRLF